MHGRTAWQAGDILAAMNRIPSPSPYAPTIGFSAAVRAGEWVHVAGITAVDAAGEIVGGDDPAAQTREVVRKIAAALEAAGAGLQDVVRTRIYLTDKADWEAVGRAHGEAFADIRPVAAMLVVGLLDPRMRVEIEVVAYVGSTRSRRAPQSLPIGNGLPQASGVRSR